MRLEIVELEGPNAGRKLTSDGLYVGRSFYGTALLAGGPVNVVFDPVLLQVEVHEPGQPYTVPALLCETAGQLTL